MKTLTIDDWIGYVFERCRIGPGRQLDEIHNIDLHTTNGAGASDMLKHFAERIPAAFVYAGIDVERAGLLSGPRGEQIAGRFARVRTGPFPRTADWTKLVSVLEGSLRLYKHRPGSLTGLSEYLHQRTGGMIGSLPRLIRSAAIQAVLDGTERITHTVLAQIELGIAAQDAALPRAKAAWPSPRRDRCRSRSSRIPASATPTTSGT